MRSACFVDTNVLVYPYDPREPTKGDIARSLIGAIQDRSAGVVSAQVLGELFRTLSRLMAGPAATHAAAEVVEYYASFWEVCPLSVETVLEGMHGAIGYRLHFWDALIWATAKRHGLTLVLSEDFGDGWEFEGVLFRNPFLEGFELDAALG
jgi:predicted nucleic acid-binding protein